MVTNDKLPYLIRDAYHAHLHKNRERLKVYKDGMSIEEFREENRKMLYDITFKLEDRYQIVIRVQDRHFKGVMKMWIADGIEDFLSSIGVRVMIKGTGYQVEGRNKGPLMWEVKE